DKYVAKLRTLNVVAKDADNLEANDLPITPEKSSPQDRQAKIFEELDTFLQYGLYEKAINLLGDAFKSDFNSQDIKMKLFEVAKVCDKQKAFEVLSIVKQTATEQGFTETSSEIDEFMSLHSIEAHEVSPVEETRLESVEVFKDEEDVFEPSYERSLAQVEAVSADQVSPKEDNGHIEFGESGTEDSNFLAGFEMELNEDPQVAESVDFVAHKAQEDHEDDDDDDQYEQPLANPELDDGNKIDEPVLAFNDEVSQDESLEAKKAIESPSPEASSDSFSFDLDMPVPEQDSNLSEQDSFVDFSIDVVDESASEPSIAVPVIEEIIEEPRISQEFPVERSIEDLMKDANQFIEKREFTNARDVLVNVLIKDRSYIPAIEALSKCSSSKAEVSNAAPLDVQPSPQPLNNGPQSASDLFDLSVELKDEIDDLEQQFAKPGNPDDNYLSPEEVISEFKKGVARTVAKDDYQTHYNLGIAYKEMGLLDEAIAEFETAMESEELKVSCVSMIGLCLTGKRDFSQAITLYKKILSELPAVKSPQVLGLSYELAESFIGAGYVGEAYKLFSKVCEFDPGFRDIKVRVKELEAEFGDQDSSKVSSIDKLSKKNKVSYI
ncbi:MAG: tetratricopeptide repeat protein, partial [Bdellovibrionales bacterium]|nr:tetratricopeptide repeat protein [Bdellovibrionales bacterium]